jgi:hypothetical protein
MALLVELGTSRARICESVLLLMVSRYDKPYLLFAEEVNCLWTRLFGTGSFHYAYDRGQSTAENEVDE